MKTVEELSRDLAEAYAALAAWSGKQTQAELSVVDAGEALAQQRKGLLREIEAKSLGANEAQRAAKLDGLCAPCVAALADAERARIEVRGELETARLRVEGLRCDLRLLEVAAGLRRAA